jgi:predicted transcriptional regulator
MAKVKQSRKGKGTVLEAALSLNIDLDLRRQLEERAQRDERSISYLVRKAIEQYLSGPPKEVTA